MLSDSKMRLQAQVNQLGVLGVVIVVFGFDARIGQVADFHGQVNFLGGGLYHSGEIHDRKTVR